MRDQEISRNIAAFSRRRFAGTIVAAAAIALLPDATAGENGNIQGQEKDPGSRPEDLSVADWDEVRARYSELLRVYGERLSAEEKQHAVRILTTNQHMLASIRSFVVQNGDPSACTLRIYEPEPPAQAPTRS
jgi:hypothetical protein